MKKLKFYLQRGVALALWLSVASCHAFVTGPVVWNHDSSAAFETYVGLWFGVFFLLWVAVACTENPPNNGKGD